MPLVTDFTVVPVGAERAAQNSDPLARARELQHLDPRSDAYGFLETELLRGRNAVEATLMESAQQIDRFLATGRATSSSSRREP